MNVQRLLKFKFHNHDLRNVLYLVLLFNLSCGKKTNLIKSEDEVVKQEPLNSGTIVLNSMQDNSKTPPLILNDEYYFKSNAYVIIPETIESIQGEIGFEHVRLEFNVGEKTQMYCQYKGNVETQSYQFKACFVDPYKSGTFVQTNYPAGYVFEQDAGKKIILRTLPLLGDSFNKMSAELNIDWY